MLNDKTDKMTKLPSRFSLSEGNGMKLSRNFSFLHYIYRDGKKIQKKLVYPPHKRSCVILRVAENSLPSRYFPFSPLWGGGGEVSEASKNAFLSPFFDTSDTCKIETKCYNLN
jgi:hypothetical protein